MRGVPPASRHLLCRGLVVLVRLDLLYLGQSVQPPHDPTEDRMLTVEVRGALEGDEELAAIGVGPGVGHG